MALEAALLEFAARVDPERAAGLRGALPAGRGLALGVVLGSAFAPLAPHAAWQLEALERVAADGWQMPRQRADLLDRLLSAAGPLDAGEAALQGLRRAVWGEKARIALRELLPHDLGGSDAEITARELSDLAEATLEVALAEAQVHVERRFGAVRRSAGGRGSLVVLGLGKLGGRELNAGSDVDILFAYDTDDARSGTSAHDHWSRVARRAVATLDEPSADGLLWRVDLRLRPEGSQGPVVNSLDALDRYYETWGRTWERAALLRSRAVAGDLDLGDQLAREVVVPFVFRREVDPGVALALAEMVERSREELSAAPERDLKLGVGGIREAEFFVQALQLVWGGREPTLRVAGTLAALDRLAARGLATPREVAALREAWVLLRRAEHHVQWSTGVQTHLLPERPADLDRLARGLGWVDGAALSGALGQQRERVAELFRSVLPHEPVPRSRHRSLLSLLERDDPALAAAAEAAFRAPEVAEHLRALARRADGLLSRATRDRHPGLADAVLDAIADSSDPEQCARMLRSLMARLRAAWPYYAALAEDPYALRRLTTVVGASAFVGETLVAAPELLEVVLWGSGEVEAPRRLLAAELDGLPPPSGDRGLDREEFVGGLRRAKQRAVVQVAVRDLAGAFTQRETTRALADVADAVIERAVAFELGADAGGLAVIALGKLGGRDIGYGSDLDVIFVYDGAEGDPAEESARWARHAQRIIRLISDAHPAGPGYELDTRLRPSGSQGLLVTSLRAFARYHGVPLPGEPAAVEPSALSSGAAWERQALLRARCTAGDARVGSEVVRVAQLAAYERGAPPVEELHRLRLRMEHELGRERPGRWDLKLGHGGLLDVEFAVQWLQMAHGRDRRVRTPDTLSALDALALLGHMSRPAYETLREGYGFLRRLEQRIVILHGRSSTLLDERVSGLLALARRMGFSDGPRATAADALITRYREVTRGVRQAYLQVLHLEA